MDFAFGEGSYDEAETYGRGGHWGVEALGGGAGDGRVEAHRLRVLGQFWRAGGKPGAALAAARGGEVAQLFVLSNAGGVCRTTRRAVRLRPAPWGSAAR